ncbi:MAG: hypothetical protein ABWW70_06990 [Thermoproteota archaeon]
MAEAEAESSESSDDHDSKAAASCTALDDVEAVALVAGAKKVLRQGDKILIVALSKEAYKHFYKLLSRIAKLLPSENVERRAEVVLRPRPGYYVELAMAVIHVHENTYYVAVTPQHATRKSRLRG